MIRFASRQPVAFSVLVVFVAVFLIKLLDVGLMYLPLPELARRLIVEAAFGAYVAFLLVILRWWRATGFKQPATPGKLLAFLPMLFLPVVLIASNGLKLASPDQMILFTLYTLLVGFAEEGLLRGVILHALLPGGLKRAVLLSSLLFGIGHLTNLLQGYSPATTIVQIIYSTLLGIGFAGVRLYTGSIWPAILAHTLIDLGDTATRGFVLPSTQPLTVAGVIAPIIITGLYALYGWWLLRRTATGHGAA